MRQSFQWPKERLQYPITEMGNTKDMTPDETKQLTQKVGNKEW